jgi:leucyl aminopeptidase
MNISFNNNITSNILVLSLAEEFDLDRDINFKNISKEVINNAIKIKEFKGSLGQSVSIATDQYYVILLGVGNCSEFNNLSAVKLGGNIISLLNSNKLKQSVSVVLDNRISNVAENFSQVAYGMALRNYKFNKYKSAEKLKEQITIGDIEIVTNMVEEARSIFDNELSYVAESVHFSRNLISEPANIIYPETFVSSVKSEFSNLNVEIEILDEEQMLALGMHALLGVGQGSAKESRMLIIKYNGGDKNDAALAFVGKGVTFDTGGISIKPSNGMEDMKYDMSGAAVVVGVIKAAALRKAKVNIVAVAGLVENMPDGNAQRPSDVVKSMSGQTIEILNTDAEGRLVLADALWYCQDRFKPQIMIDLATLTGAMIISLGTHRAGLFSNDENLTKKLLESADETNEKLWHLPMGAEYDKMIDSTIADVRNTGNGKGAGSITAAQFLKRFVNNVPWAHLDIAGVSWANNDSEIHPVGATAFGVRLLNDLVKKYEKL